MVSAKQHFTTTPRSSQIEKNRKQAKASTVTPLPIRMSGVGSVSGKTTGTATTTHPARARSNVTSRGTFVVFVA